MEFKELEKQVLNTAAEYRERHNLVIDVDLAALKLGEEVGELFQAILIHQGKSRKEKRVPEAESKQLVATELADVVGMATLLADVLEIDLERAVKEKWSVHI